MCGRPTTVDEDMPDETIIGPHGVRELRLVVPATSLADVHSLLLYPAMASHRDIAPKHRARLGIHDNLVRLSAGIEAPEDIIADLDQALRV